MTNRPDQSNDLTGQRLLHAAGEVFAEHGFRDATVREICRRAGANIAAVNYHFGDKAKLYAETMQHLARQAVTKYPPDMGVSASSSPQQRLHAFVRSFILRILSDDRAALFGRILAREFVEPTEALTQVVQNVTLPMRDVLIAIIRGLEPNAADEQVRRCAFSVVGQIVFYKHCAPVISLVFPGGERCDAQSLDALADHITAFSLAGIDAIVRGRGADAAARAKRPTTPRRAARGKAARR